MLVPHQFILSVTEIPENPIFAFCRKINTISSLSDLNAKGVILQAFEMFRLKTCVDFKPYEGEKTYLKFEKLDG